MNLYHLIKKFDRKIPIDKEVILILGATKLKIDKITIDRLYYRILDGLPYDIDYDTIIKKAKYIRAVMKAYEGDYSEIDII